MKNRFSAVPLVLIAFALSGCVDGDGARLEAGASPAQTSAANYQALAREPEGLSQAKSQFRAQNFGLSAESFRRIVETNQDSAEAWLGLAASYDELARFDLADRAYEQVQKLSGRSSVLLNNRGYSYLKRGDKKRARQDFLSARALDPANGVVLNNLTLAN